MCPGFGRTCEEIWVFHGVWQLQDLLLTQTSVRDLWLQGERDILKLFPLDLSRRKVVGEGFREKLLVPYPVETDQGGPGED